MCASKNCSEETPNFEKNVLYGKEYMSLTTFILVVENTWYII